MSNVAADYFTIAFLIALHCVFLSRTGLSLSSFELEKIPKLWNLLFN
jgi:hypothetical protein